MIKKTQSNQLNILILSDIHLQKQYLSKLKVWYLQYTKLFPLDLDYIIIPGDSCNVEYNLPTAKNQSYQLQAESQFITVLEFLEFFGCEIIFIPGNHDPLCLYHNKKLTNQSIGVHKSTINLTQDLILYGFGGSVPGYLNGLKVWDGYPFENDDQFQKQFKTFWPKQTTKQYILLVHNGPNNSNTTLARNNNKQIKSGSTTLDKYLAQLHNNLLLVIHGHTHDGLGSTLINRVPIINPGALTNGNFGILNLASKEGKWGIKELRFINLNYN